MAVDLSKLAFDTAYRYERIATKKTYSFTLAANSSTKVSDAHGLGYTPYIKFFYDFGDGKVFPLLSSPSSYNIDGNAFQIDNVYADNNQINFSFENDSASTVTINVHVRIYAESQS